MSEAVKVPKHYWIVAVVALLWNLVGAYDYLMTQTKNEAYMSQFEPAQLEYFYGFPTWVEASWAIAIWGGVLGCVLLLFRKCPAVLVFAISFVAMLVTSIYNFGLSNGMEVMGTEGFIFSLVIFIISLFLVLYSLAMKKRDIIT